MQVGAPYCCTQLRQINWAQYSHMLILDWEQLRLEGTLFGQTLTHWGRVTHNICVGKLTIIGSDNGLSPERRQAIIWSSAGILLIGPLGTNFSEIVIEIQTFSLKKTHLKMSSADCCSFRLGLNVLYSNNNLSHINNYTLDGLFLYLTWSSYWCNSECNISMA